MARCSIAAWSRRRGCNRPKLRSCISLRSDTYRGSRKVEIETECKPHRDSLVQEERRAVVVAAVLAISMVVVPGCRRKERALSNMVNMSDPTTATQLVSGFHAVESGAWRWTMKRFSLI